MVFHDELYKKVGSFAKSNRPLFLTPEECLDILLLQTHMRHEHELKRSRNGPGRPTKVPRVIASISKSLRRKKELVQSICADYTKSRAIQTKLVAANRNTKRGVILNCRYVTDVLQEFVRERKVTTTRTAAKDML